MRKGNPWLTAMNTPPRRNVSSENPAMVNAVEKPSATKSNGSLDNMQRPETRSRQRNNVSMKQGKAHVTVTGWQQQS
ncbi:MAG: hypothetical protein ACXABV_18200 [Candidatus Thorarchaeota archaeon]